MNEELLSFLKETYLRMQILANKNILYAIATDSMRAQLRNQIASMSGRSAEEIQNENEAKAFALSH